MIYKPSDVTIRMFMKGAYDEDCGDIENFVEIFDVWLELSGIGNNKQTALLTAIHNVSIRMMVVPEMINFQLKYMKVFNEPYEDGFWFFHKHGHKPKWNPENPENFIQQLEMIERKELRHHAEYDKLKKELADLQVEGIKTDKNGRHEFLKLMNEIGHWRGYDIDIDKMDIERYSLITYDYLNRVDDPAKRRQNARQ